MAVSSEVMVSRDGAGGNAGLPPQLLMMFRWCVSCLWSCAELVRRILALRRLPSLSSMTVLLRSSLQLRSHLGSPQRRSPPAVAPPGSQHISPEPKVECVVLYAPENAACDVIFVHGLYGSLANTWRQGEWKSKYKIDPKKVSLRRPSSNPTPCSCVPPPPELNPNKKVVCLCDNITKRDPLTNRKAQGSNLGNEMETYLDNVDSNSQVYNKDCITNIINSDVVYNTTNHVDLVEETCELYTNDQIEIEVENCDNVKPICDKNTVYKNDHIQFYSENSDIETLEKNSNLLRTNRRDDVAYKRDEYDYKSQTYLPNDGSRDDKEEFRDKSCEVGCGCVCARCYSACWPRDWLQVDYPDARVISINYTSDPHLWRPVWVKESKRLRLHQRAEQMMTQLLDLGVGSRPIVWVGHSKGGLFIKQIYSEAYDTFLKANGKEINGNVILKDNNKNVPSSLPDVLQQDPESNDTILKSHKINKVSPSVNLYRNTKKDTQSQKKITNSESNSQRTDFSDRNVFIKYEDDEKRYYSHSVTNDSKPILDVNSCFINDCNCDKENLDKENAYAKENNNQFGENDDTTSNKDAIDNVDVEDYRDRSVFWTETAGFMFYSVPHKGSPLADIDLRPLMARSIELLEIRKDCSLVLALHERWLRATSAARTSPIVRSLVETCRTLMAVLWLRIVSVESADAGIGALCGVSVDHREICKPSSRSCLLYCELLNLIDLALNKPPTDRVARCNCQ